MSATGNPDKDALKDKFSDGESPSGTDFAELIDSCFNGGDSEVISTKLGAIESIGFYTDDDPNVPIEPLVTGFTSQISSPQRAAQATGSVQSADATTNTVPTTDAVTSYVNETSAKKSGDSTQNFNANNLTVTAATTTNNLTVTATTTTDALSINSKSVDDIAKSDDDFNNDTKNKTLATTGFVEAFIEGNAPNPSCMPAGTIMRVPESVGLGDFADKWIRLDGQEYDITDWDEEAFSVIKGMVDEATVIDSKGPEPIFSVPDSSPYYYTWMKIKN